MSSYHEGNTKYRLTNHPMSRQYRVTGETFMEGKKDPLVHFVTIGHHEVGGVDEAMMEGVERIRPKVARAESLAKGIELSVPADPVIDRAIAAKAERDRKHAELLASIKEEQEIAGALLNESNPIWGTF